METKTDKQPAVRLTDEQLEQIAVGSQQFAELSADDKLRLMMLENKALRDRASGKIVCKFGNKSTTDPTTKKESPAKFNFNVYGLGRFPASHYASQWIRLLDPAVVRDILSQILKHAEQASWKDGMPMADGVKRAKELAEKYKGL